MSPRTRNKLLFLSAFFAVIVCGIFASHAVVAQSVADSSSTLNQGVAILEQPLGLPTTDLRITIARIIRVALGLLGVVALGLILYAGFTWMTAGGNEEKITTAKKILINATIGLAIILSSYAITSFIINKLVEATTGVEANNNNPGGGGGNPYWPEFFFIKSLPTGGQMCIRNFHPMVVFNRDVDISTMVPPNVAVINASTSQQAVGNWVYGAQKNTAVFMAAGDCDNGDNIKDCLDADTSYTLEFHVDQNGGVKSLGGQPLTLNCAYSNAGCGPVHFRTGESVDRLPPTVHITYPASTTLLSAFSGTPVKASINYTDDNGVQNIALYNSNNLIDSKSIPGCFTTGTVEIDWPIANLGPGKYPLEAVATDWSAQQAQDFVTVRLDPAHCFNTIKDVDENGIDCGGNDCRKCAGQGCSQNDECQGGLCSEGVCINRAQITGVNPNSGAPGTYVTISGLFFGANPGHVYFASTTNPTSTDWIEAKIVDCGYKSWNNWQIIAEVPAEATGSGPIKVETASTTGGDGLMHKFVDLTDDKAIDINAEQWGPVLPDFVVTNQVRPGLCQVSPSAEQPGGGVVIAGKNLGLGNINSKVNFASSGALVNTWQNVQISSVVPYLNSGPVPVSVSVAGTQSNAVRFFVQSGFSTDTPLISSVTPDSGPTGEYITINGKNFGEKQGKIWFKQTPNSNALDVEDEFSFPKPCAASVWHDNEIIVKAPGKNDGVVGANYYVQVQTGDSDPRTSPLDENARFSLVAGTPSPGICLADPSFGPVPLPASRTMHFVGENFGNDPSVYYWKVGASSTDVVGRALASKDSPFELILNQPLVDNGEVINALPPTSTMTGPVVVYRGGDKKMSNPVSFTVLNCIQNNNSCSDSNFHCCIGGGDAGICKPNGQLCDGETRFAGFSWRFSTKDLPEVPKVVERCPDYGTIPAGQPLPIPTPSPNVKWDSQANQDNQQVCRQALSIVEFSTPISQATVGKNQNSVLAFKCTQGVKGNDCLGANAVELTADSFVLQKAIQGQNGSGGDFLSIQPNSASSTWEDDTWYQVVLTKNIQSVSSSYNSSVPLLASHPCSVNGSAYCYVFKTGHSDCSLDKVLITPYSYWTRVLESPMNSHPPGGDPYPVFYFGNGLSSQHCIMMDMSGYSWKWSVDNQNSTTTYADIFNGLDTGRKVQVSALANTVAVGLKNPSDAVNIEATATTNTPNGKRSKTGDSPLKIDLSDPAPIDWWPRCQEVCTNAEVGIRFNTSMSNRNIPGQNVLGTVQLLKCNDGNCLSTTPVQGPRTVSLDQLSQNTILKIANYSGAQSELDPNTRYQVIVSASSSDLNATNVLWSVADSQNQKSFSKPYNKEFSWTFTTKKDRCLIDRVDVTPTVHIAQSIDGRAVYQVQPFSAPDSCSAKGQQLNPSSVTWSWRSLDTNVATVFATSTLGKNSFCTDACVRKGSTIISGLTTSTLPVCGNGVIEAGEDCDSPSFANGCGLNCLYMGSAANTCGNGVLDRDAQYDTNGYGEACDPAATSTIGCSKQCQNTGSKIGPDSTDVHASVCGNGTVDKGEACDIKIAANISSSTSALGCSEQCLHQGTRLSTQWCFNNQNTFGGFTQTDYNAACKLAYSQCGDGVASPDEDPGCDVGNGNHANWCNEYCLRNDTLHPANGCALGVEGCDGNLQYKGSSLFYSSPSTCGDGVRGFGEDAFCENRNNFTNTTSAYVNPWALAMGVGKGFVDASTTPPSQKTSIVAATSQKTKGGAITGSGTFIIACGFKTDQDCEATVGPGYGVSDDSCCYLRPHLTAVYPGSTSTIANNICPNTAIEATFDSHIDVETLAGNLLIAHGDTVSQGVPVAVPIGVVTSTLLLGGPFDRALPMSMTISGNYLYATVKQTNALVIVDISNPNKPKIVGTVDNQKNGANVSNPTGVAIVGTYALVPNYGLLDSSNVGLGVIDVSDPTKPKGVNFANPAIGANFSAIATASTTAYITADEFAALGALDISDLKDIKLHSRVSANIDNALKLGNPKSVAVSGKYAYVVAYADNSVTVFDISDPKNLIQVSSVDLAKSQVNRPVSLALYGTNAYVVSEDSLVILDIGSNPANPSIQAVVKTGQNGAVLRGGVSVVADAYGLAYVAEADSGILEVFDVTSSTKPRHLASIANLPGASSVAVRDGVAYVGTVADGAIHAFDVSSFKPAVACNGKFDVTQLVAQASLNDSAAPWYSKIWRQLVAFVKNVFASQAEAGPQVPVPSKWCTDTEAAVPSVLKINDTSSKIVLNLLHPLSTTTAYTVILTDGVKDTRGVSVGSLKNGKAISWKFNTASSLCAIDSAAIKPSQVVLTRPSATSSLTAEVYSESKQKLQPIAGAYDWNYVWAPQVNTVVDVQNTSSSVNVLSAKNHNGEIDVAATPHLVAAPPDADSLAGISATSHVTVFLCENPWPTKQAAFGGDTVSPFPYNDIAGNHSGFDLASGTFGIFDGSAIIAGSKVRNNGYYNFSSYYCMDKGLSGTYDDLPFLRPAIQTDTTTLRVTSGLCEVTGNSCKGDADCGVEYQTNIASIILSATSTSVCGASTSTITRYYTDNQGKGIPCTIAADCSNPDFTKWANNFGTPKCLALGNNYKNLSCYTYSALKRFIFTNDKNSDAIGMQVFENPNHFTADQWFYQKKESGGLGFSGQVRTIKVQGGKFNGVRDDNNVYVDVIDFSTTTQSIASYIYLLSINADAQSETRQVFDSFINNIQFNTNLTNYGYCAPNMTSTPAFDKPCSNDLDCDAGQLCSVQADKLRRNYTRIRDFRIIEDALKKYYTNNSSYPNLKSGTFLAGNAVSTWDSWNSALGNEIQSGLPVDPINKLGLAGSCASTTGQFCTDASGCPLVPNSTSTHEACVLHDSATGWSTENRRFSFACSPFSYAYRYVYDATSSGYILKGNFEDPGIQVDPNSQALFFAGYLDAKNYSGLVNNKGWGICTQQNEISSLNRGFCGDHVVNWNRGEVCDPSGYKDVDASSCQINPQGNASIKICSPDCLSWITSTTPCSTVRKCGNGKVEPGEACDDGKYNGTYNRCNATCSGIVGAFGQNNSAGYCGDGQKNPAYEVCDAKSTLAGKTGLCIQGVNFGVPCNSNNDCNSNNGRTSANGYCEQFTTGTPFYGITQGTSCNFDCQSFGPYCGNGIVEKQYGEECDGNQVCGNGGTQSCKDCRMVNTAAIAQWKLNADYSVFNGGISFVDTSNHNNTAQCTNGAACPQVNFNDAKSPVLFDNLKYLTVNHTASMDINALTIESWFKVTDPMGWQGWANFVAKKPDINEGNQQNIDFSLGFSPAGTSKVVSLGINSKPFGVSVATLKTPYNQNEWHHVAVTVDAARNVKFYSDGEEVKDVRVNAPGDPNASANNNYPMFIGNFGGQLSNVQVYSRVLTADEIKNEYQTGWFCSTTPAVEQVAKNNSARCGDGKVGSNEACDNGDALNGKACSASYNKPCSYCSADCQNVIHVQPNQYCGNGILEAQEKCETNPNNSQILIAASSSLFTGSFVTSSNGYLVLSCAQEPKDASTYKKGSKVCANSCSTINVVDTGSNACLVCGIDKQKGVSVSGGIINTLFPFSSDPLFTLANQYNNWIVNAQKGQQGVDPNKGELFFYATGTPIAQTFNFEPNADLSNVGYGSYYLKPMDVDPVTSTERALISSDILCAPDYKIKVNNDLKHAFDFPGMFKSDSTTYDLVLTPVIASNGWYVNPDVPKPSLDPTTARPNDIRVVVRWKGPASFSSGFVIPTTTLNANVVYDGGRLGLTNDIKYFLGDTRGTGIWYHGAGNTLAGTQVESFTVDSSLITSSSPYMFFVRTSNKDAIYPFKDTSDITVEVYLPEDDKVYYHFARPTKVLHIKDADPLQNSKAAPYWQVLTIKGTDLAPNVADRVKVINEIRTKPDSFNYSL